MSSADITLFAPNVPAPTCVAIIFINGTVAGSKGVILPVIGGPDVPIVPEEEAAGFGDT